MNKPQVDQKGRFPFEKYVTIFLAANCPTDSFGLLIRVDPCIAKIPVATTP